MHIALALIPLILLFWVFVRWNAKRIERMQNPVTHKVRQKAFVRPHEPLTIRKAAREAVAAGCATIVGILVFYLVFAWPILTGSNLMLAWGWVGWIPGIVLGHRVGGLARSSVRRAFL